MTGFARGFFWPICIFLRDGVTGSTLGFGLSSGGSNPSPVAYLSNNPYAYPRRRAAKQPLCSTNIINTRSSNSPQSIENERYGWGNEIMTF